MRAFWEFLDRTDDAVIYVYSSKERATLKRLMQRYLHLLERILAYIEDDCRAMIAIKDYFVARAAEAAPLC